MAISEALCMISKWNLRITTYSMGNNISHLNKSFELRASRNFLHKVLHTSVGVKEGNLLGIKAVHERRNISKELAWRGGVRWRTELRRPCGSFLFSFVLLVFSLFLVVVVVFFFSPHETRPGSFFLPFVKATRWVRVSFTNSPMAPRSETPLNKTRDIRAHNAHRRVYQFTNRARSIDPSVSTRNNT